MQLLMALVFARFKIVYQCLDAENIRGDEERRTEGMRTVHEAMVQEVMMLLERRLVIIIKTAIASH